MNKFFLLILAATICVPLDGQETNSASSNAKSPQKLKVLFIGNSYTFGLPETIVKLATANDRALAFKSVAKGGWTLKKHSGSDETLAAIRDGNWDFVVLQEQSQIPSLPEERRAADMYPYAKKLHTEIAKTKARTLFYLTWGRAKGDKQNVPDDDFDQMQKRLKAGYETIANQCSAAIVPVGTAWGSARAKDSSINLYQDDGSHPNAKGRYLSACVFTRFLFNADVVVGLDLPANEASESESKLLQNVANSLKF